MGNRAISSEMPELEKITDQSALNAIGLVLPEELQPIFATRFERQKALVTIANSQIEVRR